MRNLDQLLADLYNPFDLSRQSHRWNKLIKCFYNEFGKEKEGEVSLFSSPGRTEIGGNHTDHNHGLVLTAAIDLDIIAAARPRQDMNIHVTSNIFPESFHINLNDLGPCKSEYESSPALIRGMAACLKKEGYHIGGFDAFIASELPAGKGMSSSAAFEVLIGQIYHSLFNKNNLDLIQLAQAAQKAESEYFGKPCGLMDQLACTYGGLLFIDFKNSQKPIIKNIETPPFEKQGLKLFFLDDQGDHSGLSSEYAALSKEMHSVAAYFKKDVLREVGFKSIKKNMSLLRSKLGDRAVMRSLHYFQENERVKKQMTALLQKNLDLFLCLVRESGRSSWMLLQNCINPKTPQNQSMGLVWALTDFFFSQNVDYRGACRVHGGGFGGAVQVYIDQDIQNTYQKFIQETLGKERLLSVSIRKKGVCHLMNIQG